MAHDADLRVLKCSVLVLDGHVLCKPTICHDYIVVMTTIDYYIVVT